MDNKIYEYVGTSPQLKNSVVTIERETNKSYYINYRPMGGVDVEIRRVSKTNLRPHQSLKGF